jgi:hypothetical protein
MAYTYELVSDQFGEVLVRTSDDGVISYVPIDPANSDYKAYLNRDNPVEHFTPIVTDAD